MLRIALAAIHLLALGIGLGAVWSRARSLRGPLDLVAIRRAFVADSWWGVAAVVWIASGAWRLLAGTEKPMGYYFHDDLFFAKMGLLAVILLLEVWPMVTLIRWRIADARGTLDPGAIGQRARRIAIVSYAQSVLVVFMVIAAVSMARGYGQRF